jgi:hypothetical protein
MPRADGANLVDAFRRARRCDRILNMPADERHKYALKYKNDPQFQLAVIEAYEGGEDLGLSETLFGEIIDDAKRRLNGPLLEEVEYDKRILESVKSALDVELSDLHKEAVSVDPALADLDRFHARVKEVASLAEPLWLREFEEDDGTKVIRAAKFEPGAQTGSWVKATEDEKNNGIFAATRDEFEKLKTATATLMDRKSRVEFVNEHGAAAYLNRHAAA